VVAEDADVSLGDPCVEPIHLMGDEPTLSSCALPPSPVKRGAHRGQAVGANRRQCQLRQADSGGRVQTEARGPRLSFVLRTPMDRAAEAHRAEFDEFDLAPKIVYRTRSAIGKMESARAAGGKDGHRPLYIRWARLVATLYAGFAWSPGRLGKLLDELGLE
jgi:hypothetical protein